MIDGVCNFQGKYWQCCDINSWTSQQRRNNDVTFNLQAEYSPVNLPSLNFSSTSTAWSTSSVSAGEGPQVPHHSSTWAARAGQLKSPSTPWTSLLGLMGGVISQLLPCVSSPCHCDSSKLLASQAFHSSSQATIRSSSGQTLSHSNHQLLNQYETSA
jgi:hypothetical protein